MRIFPLLALCLVATGIAGCNAEDAATPEPAGVGTGTGTGTGGATTAQLAITSALQLPTGTVGVGYNTTLSATGGTAPYGWRVVAGSLPSGLSLNQTTGVISGTPTSAISANLTIAVSDTNAASTSGAFTVQVLPAGLAISSALQMPNGTVGSPYSTTLAASGGTQPFTWQVTAGALPSGLALNATTGVIAGTPTASGTASPTITVTDAAGITASAGLAVQVFPAGLVITSGAQLPNGVVGTAYTPTLAASGGTLPYRWQVTAGTLPSGLSLGAATGIISGTPTSASSANPTITVTDAASVVTSMAFSLRTLPTPVVINTAAQLPNGTIGVGYSVTLAASGGTTPYTWRVVSGSLPAGLSLSQSTGVISGTPTTAINASVGISATDASSASTGATFALRVIPAPLVVTTAAQLPNGTVAIPYSTTLAATGGTTPYRWTVTAGSLPAGLTLNQNTGVISGIPLSAVTSTPTITVTDANATTASAGFSLRTVAAGLVISTGLQLASGTVGVAYSTTLAATGGTTPFTWAVTAGALPAGLSLNATTGVISGTPTAAVNATPTITVTDASAASISAAFSLRVTAPSLGITSSTQLPNGTVNTAYSRTLAASGGTPPYSWQVTAGSLPTGLTLNGSTGVISGTPTAATTTSPVITVTDAGAASAAATFALTIDPAAGSSGWTLVWSDEFDGTTLDGSKWLNPTNDNSCGALVKSTFMGDDAYLDGNGHLVLRAQSRASGGCGTNHVTAGQVSTKGRFSQAYGRFEFRAQLPTGGSGSWPALWMYPIGNTWPPEIDLLEMQADSNTAFMSYHWGTEATH